MFSTPQQHQYSTRSKTSLSSSRVKKKEHNVSRTESAEVLHEGEGFVAMSLDSPLPVRVQEALRVDDRVTVKLHVSGWAWLVRSSRLLLWRYLSNQLITKCYQVSLPGSGIGWNAELLTIVSCTSEAKVSLLGCSPEGVLCWWSDLVKSASQPTLLGSVDVGEGAVCSVSSLPGTSSCLVTTSQANIWLATILPASQTSACELSVRALMPPHGVLSGIGRRVSSLFFGSHATTEVRELRRAVVYRKDEVENVALVLTNNSLQRWRITAQLTEELLSDISIVSLLKDCVLVAGWMDVACDLSVLIVDLQVCKLHAALLFTFSADTSSEYGIACFPVDSDPSPSNIKKLIRLNISVPAREPSLLTGYALHGIHTLSSVLIIGKNTVLMADVLDGSVENILSSHQQPLVLGSGEFSDQLLLFTLLHGVVSITQRRSSSPPVLDSNKSVSYRHGPSLIATPASKPGSFMPTPSILAEEEIAESVQVLKKAFSQLYLEGDVASAASLCEEHFPSASFHAGLNTCGDCAVIHLSELILDDPPPQVDSSFSDAQGDAQGKKSLIIIYHIQQKIEAHNKYIQFLVDVSLLSRLTCVSHHGDVVPTTKVLCEHGEILEAARTLKKMQTGVVDAIIGLVVSNRRTSGTPLSQSDAFYTTITQFEDFFPALIQHQREALALLQQPQEKVELLQSASTVLDSVLKSALFYRQAKASIYDTAVQAGYLPWTASKGTRGTRHSITEQLDMLLEVGVTAVQGDQDDHWLWSNIESLTDILFNGYRAQLESFKLTSTPKAKQDEVQRSFQAQRKKYLNLLLDYGKVPSVAKLAEKYEDFQMLVTVCQGIGSSAKLKEYMVRFKEQGFSDFLFKLYLDEGRLQHLLSFSEDFPVELDTFLKPHLSLSWHRHLAVRDYGNAQKTLKKLAEQETKCVQRKKTYLSLSKLSMLASRPSEEEKADELNDINSLLQHISVQETIPQEVVQAAGMDYDCTPSLSPQTIIELLVGEHNPSSDEHHFLVALEYLQFAASSFDEATFKDLAVYIWSRAILKDEYVPPVYIWSRAILKDDWTQFSAEDVLVELRTTFFYQLLNGALQHGWRISEILPGFKSLIRAPAITEMGLDQDRTFLHLVRAGYEQIERELEHRT